MRSARLAGALLFAGAVALYTSTIAHHYPAPDERARYDLARALADRGIGALRGSGNACRYPPLTSLVAAPFIATFSKIDRRGSDDWARRGAAVSNIVLTALVVVAFFALLSGLGYAPRVAVLGAALFAIANPLWPYTKRFYSEPLSALLVLTTAWGVLRVRTAPKRGIAALAISVALLGQNNWSVAAAVGAAALVALAIEKNWRRVAIIAGLFAVGAGLAIAMQVWRYGRFATGYEGESFKFHLWESVPGLLIGPGRSIFLFAPTCALGLLGLWKILRSGNRQLTVFAAACFAFTFLTVAAWWAWYGGMCFGPRLMLPVLPLVSLFFAHYLEHPRWKWPIRAMALWGLWVQLLGVSLSHEYDAYLWMKQDSSDEYLSWFSPLHSTLWRVPRDVYLSPWDVSADLMTRVNRESTGILGDGQPLRYVQVGQEGQSILYTWAVSDVAVVIGGQRHRAFELGARFEPAGTVAGTPGGDAAVDANPSSRWTPGRYRRPGMEVRIDLGKPMPLERLDLVHAPYWDDFPSHVWAKGSEDGQTWRPLHVGLGTPILGFQPAFYFLIFGCILMLTGAVVVARPPLASPEPVLAP